MTSPSLPSPLPPARASANEFGHGPLLLAIAMFVLVYGVEIFSFGLSIDEDLATFLADNGQTWVRQGRWGMALLTVALPNFEAIPLLSTLLFGAGLVFATWRAIGDFALTRPQAYLFAAVHVGFPIWLHIAQFNTLAAGFGFGIAAAALGGGAAARGGASGAVTGALLIAFATAVYQTLAIYAVLYIVLCVHTVALVPGSVRGAMWRTMFARLTVAAAVWVAGLLLYWSVQKLTLALIHADMTYVGGFIQLDQLRADPRAGAWKILISMKSLLGGSNPTYLSWGAGILFLSWLGLLPVALLSSENRHDWITQWQWVLVVAVIGIGLFAVPVILSVASLPLRAHVILPLLAAWLASRCALIALPALRWAAIGYFAVVAGSIGASLFYTDQVVHNADAALTQRIVAKVQEAGIELGQEIPITLVGERAFPVGGQLQRVEVFGTSFYEQDGGNIQRVASFMRLQGTSGLVPVPLHTRPDLLPAAQMMPTWPATGSVKLVNGIVVIKLGRETDQQMTGK
ncbi:MAG: glucosyltransferase domain-containing protein [Thermomonas sp.]